MTFSVNIFFKFGGNHSWSQTVLLETFAFIIYKLLFYEKLLKIYLIYSKVPLFKLNIEVRGIEPYTEERHG